jgi:Bacterial Ig-like domain
VKKSHNTKALCLLALASLVPGTAYAGRDSYGLGTGRSGALNVTGGMPTVVNTYTTLANNAAVGATTITVGSAMGFAMGDLVMVFRATGPLMSVPAAPPMGMPAPAIDLSANAVGRWELARIASTAGATLTLDEPLVNAFDAAGTQVIRVPEYTTVTIAMGSTLAAQAWNGTTGGVVAFLATGAITNAGAINASSRGFRGGVFNSNSGQFGCTALEESADRGQFSGESAQSGAFGVRRGRGYLANGGGGGICHNSGGGGGGNGGRGGIGGRTWRDDMGRAVGGFGGTALVYSLLDHASLGGGGGAGDGNDSVGTNGGVGGGLIFVRADSLAGAGNIVSDGQSLPVAAASANDAQSGGGAGGSIYLRLRANAACGTIRAAGGNGGSTGFVEHGPGGGGGGGRILLQAVMRAGSCTLSVNNGLAGTQGNAMATDGVNYGATPTSPTSPNIVGVTETAPPGGFVILAAPVTVTPANGSMVGNRRPVLSGTAPAGSTVLVFVDGVQVGTTTADAAGNWTFTPTSDLSFGMHSVSAIAHDPVQRVYSVRSNTNNFTVVMVADTDGDGVADPNDADDDNDGVTDVAEGNGRDPSRDSDGDGIPDFRDTSFAGFVDANMNGVDDRVDADGDGTPNHLDLDADGDGIFDVVENGNAALDANRDGRLDGNTDVDRDGLLAGVDSNDASAMVITPRTAPIDSDMDMRIDALDPDDDNDGVPTRTEVGPGGQYMPRNTDGAAAPGVTTDTRADYLDPDDDGDGILTADELGAGGAAMPLNSDATVAMGQGTADANPNYLDPDDDGDSIPTSVERTLAGMTPDPDMDMLAAWLDRDSDGDTVFDVIEAGATPATPANSDMDPARDFLDLDSDNDCVPDRDPREAGAARTNPAVPSMNVNSNCPAAAPICAITTGTCTNDRDTDMDGIPDMVETRIGTDPMNRDTDMDGIPDGSEVGAGPMFTPRDTDMDGTIDARDPDDDGDGVNTRDELGAGGFMMPRNTDAMVPMGQGTGDMLPDYLDPDDDGDAIPTRVENTLEGMTPGDMDMVPAYLDLDSDGDGVPDTVEAGATPAMPANSDGMAGAGDRPDFLDTDSDNDCVADSDMRESGAARVDPAMPAAMASDNCMDPTPICDTSVGLCVATMPPDGGQRDASADAVVRDGAVTDGAMVRDGAAADGAANVDGGAMDGGAPFVGVLSGDGACACRVPAAGGANGERAMTALIAMGGLALVYGARRKRSARR